MTFVFWSSNRLECPYLKDFQFSAKNVQKLRIIFESLDDGLTDQGLWFLGSLSELKITFELWEWPQPMWNFQCIGTALNLYVDFDHLDLMELINWINNLGAWK